MVYYECDKGWTKLIDKYVEKIQRVEPLVQFTQIKEKFAGLRIYCNLTYIDESTDYKDNMDIVYDLCELAEQESYKICEICGHGNEWGSKNKVSVRNRGWLKTLCTKHALEHGYEVSKEEQEKYQESIRKDSEKTKT